MLMGCEDHKVDARDLRLKLQRKSQQASVSGRGSQSGVRDLREKLSGTMHPQPMNYDPPKPKPEASEPARKSVAVQASTLESKKVSNAAAKKKAPQKACINSFFIFPSLSFCCILVDSQIPLSKSKTQMHYCNFFLFLISYSCVQASSTVDDFLQSLGLEKYSITFQAEEVCFFFLKKNTICHFISPTSTKYCSL